MTSSSADRPPAAESREEDAASSEEVRVTDKRRIDPETGKVRAPAPTPATDAAVGDAQSSDAPTAAPASASVGAGAPASEADGADEALSEWSADARVAELTADLQRVSAEYANYRKRVERDRAAVRELTTVSLLVELLPILDDIERAREHEELTGTFKAVGDGLEAKLAGLGLESFGTVGDLFDPEIHEALTHHEGEGLDAPICSQIYQPGFRYRDRVVRPARVAVTE